MAANWRLTSTRELHIGGWYWWYHNQKIIYIINYICNNWEKETSLSQPEQQIKAIRKSSVVIPAFLAARIRSSSIRCWAGSPSGNFSMKHSTWETTSWLLKYWYKPSDESTKNWSRVRSLWWQSEGEHDRYGAVPIYSFRNISSKASFNLGCKFWSRNQKLFFTINFNRDKLSW